MDRRLLLVLGLGAVIAAAGLFLVARSSPSTAAASPSPASALASTPLAPNPAASASPRAAAPSAAASPVPSPTCGQVTIPVAVRATAPDTGFPVAVEWRRLGPPNDLFFTLSDVAPTIPLDGTTAASITIGLAYMTGGDQFAFTAGSIDLVYDPATGEVTGDVDTGYGKNSNRATTDTSPSAFTGHLQLPDASGANGVLEGSIAHRARDFAFRVQIAEDTLTSVTGPGCASPRPSDAP